MFLTYLYNSILKLSYFPLICKFLIITHKQHKPNKSKNEAPSYRLINLLSELAKLSENILLRRIRLITQTQNIIPDNQFEFRFKHSTTQYIHRVIDKISFSFEKKKNIFLAFFLIYLKRLIDYSIKVYFSK
jgi:hypothetical protein